MAKIVTISCLLLFGVINHTKSINITRFVVPKVASFGALLELDCAYDLGNDQLYGAKWYKDNEEFFRCKYDGQIQVFTVEGVQLYHHQNALFGSCPVNLIVISNKSAGRYQCEISTEGPEFKTTAKFANLKIDNDLKPLKRTQIKSNSNEDPDETETSTQTNGSPKVTFKAGTTLAIAVCLLNLNKRFLNYEIVLLKKIKQKCQIKQEEEEKSSNANAESNR